MPTVFSANRSSVLVDGEAVEGLQSLVYRVVTEREDIRAVAKPVLRHRVITNFSAEAEGISSDDIIDKLITDVPRHQSDTLSDPKVPQVTS